MKIVATFIKIYWPIICFTIFSFIHTAIVRLAIQAAIFYTTPQIVNILTIANTVRNT